MLNRSAIVVKAGRKTSVSMPSAIGLISNTIRCWWIYAMNR